MWRDVVVPGSAQLPFELLFAGEFFGGTAPAPCCPGLGAFQSLKPLTVLSWTTQHIF
jgi:hypothetical protein